MDIKLADKNIVFFDDIWLYAVDEKSECYLHAVDFIEGTHTPIRTPLDHALSYRDIPTIVLRPANSCRWVLRHSLSQKERDIYSKAVIEIGKQCNLISLSLSRPYVFDKPLKLSYLIQIMSAPEITTDPI